MSSFPQSFLSIANLQAAQIQSVINLALKLKNQTQNENQDLLRGKVIGLYTTKPSLRTRLSFEVGIRQMGGHSLFIQDQEIGFGKRESGSDIAQVLSRYLDAFIVRSHDHLGLKELAQFAQIPIINALTDQEHPCQALADFLTIQENFGKLAGIKLSYVGDGNNVCHSLMLGSAILGLEFVAITPNGREPAKDIVNQASHLAKQNGNQAPVICDNLHEAQKADILYTDVWQSMGQENSLEKTKQIFAPYQLNNQSVGQIPVLHCLPAHKGAEISEELFNQNASLIFRQAENRLHAQKALLIKLLL